MHLMMTELDWDALNQQVTCLDLCLFFFNQLPANTLTVTSHTKNLSSTFGY